MTLYPYRLAAGHIAKATLQGSSAYLVSNLARQTDQAPYITWTLLTPVWDDGARRSVSVNGYAKVFGTPTITLTVPIMTPAMYDHWLFTYFGTDLTAPVTFEIPDKRITSASQAVVFQGLMQQPTADQLTLIRTRFWQAVPFVCTRCEIQ